MNSVSEKRREAILLLGPTGCGKTPLGAYLERKGFEDRRCIHFDFGSELRRISGGGRVPGSLSRMELRIIEHALKSGALLENESFYVAARIFDAFVRRRHVGERDVLVLNGLPRHLGQAADMDRLADIVRVIFLDCLPGVLAERIARNSGGDRTERKDDSPSAIACKLKIYQDRTIPLLDYYRRRRTPVHRVVVGVDTRPRDILQNIAGTGESPDAEEIP